MNNICSLNTYKNTGTHLLGIPKVPRCIFWGARKHVTCIHSEVFDVTSRRSFQNLEKWMDEVAKYVQGSEPLYALLSRISDGFPWWISLKKPATRWIAVTIWPFWGPTSCHNDLPRSLFFLQRDFDAAFGSSFHRRLVGTKIDLTTRLVQEAVARDWAKSKGMPYFEVSSAQGRNVETVFKEMASRLSWEMLNLGIQKKKPERKETWAKVAGVFGIRGAGPGQSHSWDRFRAVCCFWWWRCWWFLARMRLSMGQPPQVRGMFETQ